MGRGVWRADAEDLEGGLGPAAVRRASRDPPFALSTACSNLEPLVLRILIK